jgi:formylglycine-generating enzyme required for sulfatase activity
MGAPVVNVDWCDAYAYCAAAGKRLCGRVGGGAAGYAKFDDPAHSEWMAACSNGGATKYPYGAAYGGGICNGKDFTHPNHPLPAAAAASCHGAAAPYSAVFDMSGNVAEWEDACSGASGASDMCRARGGSFKSGASALRCNADAALGRASADDATGFRCCSD